MPKVVSFYRSGDHHPCWETSVWCKDGSVVMGQDATEEGSMRAALERADAHNAFLARDAKTRLREILSRAPEPSYLLTTDVTHAIRAIAEILLTDAESTSPIEPPRRTIYERLRDDHYKVCVSMICLALASNSLSFV